MVTIQDLKTYFMMEHIQHFYFFVYSLRIDTGTYLKQKKEVNYNKVKNSQNKIEQIIYFSICILLIIDCNSNYIKFFIDSCLSEDVD